MAMASPTLSSLSLKPSLGWTLPHSQALFSVRTSSPGPFRGGHVRLRGTGIGTRVAVVPIECSSRPRKKATAHHVKTRPKKHNPYDKNRKGPTKYPPLPKPPPIWGYDTSDVDGKPESKAVAKPVVVDVEAGTVVTESVENLPVSVAPDV